jgi:hypothetical protein
MKRLSYANVMATAAMFIALGGGAFAVARLPANSVGTKQLRRSSVTLSKISSATRRSLRGARGRPGADFSGAPAGGDLTGKFPDPRIAQSAVPGGFEGYVSVSGADHDAAIVYPHGLGVSGTCHSNAHTFEVRVTSTDPTAEISWIRYSQGNPTPDVSPVTVIGGGDHTIFPALTGDGLGTLIYHREDNGVVLTIPFAYHVVQNGIGTLCRIWGTVTGR